MTKKKTQIGKIVAVIRMNDYFREMKETCEKMLSIGEKELRKLRRENK